MARPRFWEPPSDRVGELIRTGVSTLLERPTELFESLDAAVADTARTVMAADPGLADALRASSRANIGHWATANLRSPGLPVAPRLGPENVGVARDVVRRGFDQTILASYRAGQNVTWQYWMAMMFELAGDRDELHEVLDISSRSIFAFVDDTLADITELIDAERAQLLDGTHVARLETVNLVLEGAPITSRRASERLRYELSARHTAAIAWSEGATPQPGGLDLAAEALARACGADRPFTVLASQTSLWVWVASADEPDLDALRAELGALPDVRMAVGTTAAGMDGFRRSHLDAAATLRLLHGSPAGTQVASYEDVQVVALATQDRERSGEFVTRTLGDLANASAELQETLRVYLREQWSATRAARVLFTHRNTILNRLARAQELLPGPLDQRAVQIGLALEIVHWLGPPAVAADHGGT
jgi:DNA-binding PucR family transcriptional regulator